MFLFVCLFFFFFNDTATTEIYTLSLHDALPIWPSGSCTRGWLPRSQPRTCRGARATANAPGSPAGCCSTRSASSSGSSCRRGATRCGRRSGRSAAAATSSDASGSPRRAARRPAPPRRSSASRSAGARRVPARLGHGDERERAPALAGARRDLAPDQLRVVVVDDEPVGIAEEPRALPPLQLGQLRLELVCDAVVAADRRRGVLLGRAPAVGLRVRVALGAADGAVDRARGHAAARVFGDQRLGLGDEGSPVLDRVRALGQRRAVRAHRPDVDGQSLALGRLERRLTLCRAPALARGVVAQRADDRHRDRGEREQREPADREAADVPPASEVRRQVGAALGALAPGTLLLRAAAGAETLARSEHRAYVLALRRTRRGPGIMLLDHIC